MSEFTRDKIIGIDMGLNTDPHFTLPESFETMTKENQDYWQKRVNHANGLKDAIIQAVNLLGVVSLDWSCEGRTRHEMHATNWSRALPQYEYIIGYNYVCYVFVDAETKQKFLDSRKNN